MSFTSVSTNKGNRFRILIPERAIVCLVEETLGFATTMKSQLMLPVCGFPSPPPEFTDGRGLWATSNAVGEIACVEVDQVLDACQLSQTRSFEWWYAPPNPPTPYPPISVTRCEVVPGIPSCALAQVPGKPSLVLVQAWYDYRLSLTYLDEGGNTGEIEVPSGRLTKGVILVGISDGGCSVDLGVECTSCEVRTGPDALSTFSRPPLSPKASVLYHSGTTQLPKA